jgi:hypothetical protein
MSHPLPGMSRCPRGARSRAHDSKNVAGALWLLRHRPPRGQEYFVSNGQRLFGFAEGTSLLTSQHELALLRLIRGAR